MGAHHPNMTCRVIDILVAHGSIMGNQYKTDRCDLAPYYHVGGGYNDSPNKCGWIDAICQACCICQGHEWSVQAQMYDLDAILRYKICCAWCDDIMPVESVE